jgi:hypothetical protein
MPWHTYVRSLMGADSQSEAARKTGVGQTTIGRWVHPDSSHERRSSQAVIAFARGYGRPPTEALVVAGFLTPQEGGYTGSIELEQVSTEALLDELRHRVQDDPPRVNTG